MGAGPQVVLSPTPCPFPLPSAVGAGPYSAIVPVQTCRAPPSPPTHVAAVPVAGSSSSIEVSWEAAAQGAQQAACTAFEVEAAPLKGRGGERKELCPARAASKVVAGLQHSTAYRVRVRAVGADGAGHGDWSAAAEVALPAPLPGEVADVAAVAVAATEAPAKPQKRRERGGGSGAPRTGLATKAATAKGPPRRGLDRLMQHKVAGLRVEVALLMLVAAVSVISILYGLWRLLLQSMPKH